MTYVALAWLLVITVLIFCLGFAIGHSTAVNYCIKLIRREL